MSLAFTKYEKFKTSLAQAAAGNLLTAGANTFKFVLSDSNSVSNYQVLLDVTEIAGGGTTGYTAGGATAALTSGATTSGTFKLILASPTAWTAGADTCGPFRYAILYNDTPTTPLANPLIGFFDYGQEITLEAGETFTITLDGSAGTFTIA